MRGLALLLTLTLVSPALAGCLENTPLAAVFGGGDELTAMEARDAGDGEAEAWRRDARLVTMTAFESRERFEATEEDLAFNHTADPHVGNGAAPSWGLLYESPGAGEQYFFVVHADGAVTDKHKSPVEEPETHVKNWRVDSDEAMDAARANATFRKAYDGAGSNRTVGLFLFNSWEPHNASGHEEDENHSHDDGEGEMDAPEGTHWGILLFGEETMAFALVNASNGRVAAAFTAADLFKGWGGSWSGSWGGGDWNWSWGGDDETTYEACHAGRLDPNNPEDAYRFPVSAQAGEMQVRLAVQKTLPTDEYTLVVTGPDGDVVAEHDGTSTRRSEEFEWSEANPAPGEYTVTLSAGETTVAVDYRLDLWAGTDRGGDWEWDWDDAGSSYQRDCP